MTRRTHASGSPDRRARRLAGMAMVEFVMILPALIVMLFGILEFGVLFFQWDRTRVGGNGTKHRIVVDKVASIPDQRETAITRTSGGADVLTVPDGYVITDNPDDSDEGAFSASIEIVDDVVFPFTAIDLGSGNPSKPSQLMMAVQLSLFGTSFARVNHH